MKIWKRYVLLNVVMIAAFLVWGLGQMYPVKSCGIYEAKIDTVYEAMEFLDSKRIGLIGGINTESLERITLGCIGGEETWRGNARQVYIVKPEEYFFQPDGTSFCQHAVVLETLEGDAQPGEVIQLDCAGGICSKNDQACFFGDGTNIMFPDNVYLVFCEPAVYQFDSDVKEYTYDMYAWNKLNLSKDDEPLGEVLPADITWGEFGQREFMVSNNEVLTLLLESKHEVIEAWGIDLAKYRE